ncbi:MAG: RDD family protein [Vampirovibrionales bacterium]|jgi:uncharacterized RDD family membrane protein YckC
MSNNEEISYSPNEFRIAGAWRRFFARIFDIEFTGLLLCLPITLLCLLFPVSKNIVENLSAMQGLFISVFLTPFSFLADSFVHDVFGNTLGKQLLGVRVINQDNTPLSLTAYLKRNFAVYIKGLWFYLPLLDFIPMLKEARRIRYKLPSSYDEDLGYQVIASPLKWWKVLIFSILAFNYVVISLISYIDDFK